MESGQFDTLVENEMAESDQNRMNGPHEDEIGKRFECEGTELELNGE